MRVNLPGGIARIYDDTEPSEKIKIYDKGVTLHPPGTFGEFQLTYRTGDMVAPSLENNEPLLTKRNTSCPASRRRNSAPRRCVWSGRRRAFEMAANSKTGLQSGAG